jgi:hypothetical protein
MKLSQCFSNVAARHIVCSILALLLCYGEFFCFKNQFLPIRYHQKQVVEVLILAIKPYWNGAVLGSLVLVIPFP